MTLYTIPPDVNFLRALARGLLDACAQGGADPLSAYKILLPNRRGCQNLRDAFLDLSDGQIMLLPQITPLGDVEEEELYLSGDPVVAAELAAVPPALSNDRRRFMLMRLIRQMDVQTGIVHRPVDQALGLASALGTLLDQVTIEETSLERLEEIVPEEFADHWQITLDFLDILRDAWPKILAEHGVIEQAARRRRLLDIRADHWRAHPPQTPIIAAGSTGTMPATARLMGVINDLPKGMVVLPALDLELDEESWEYIDASHPQFLLKDFLTRISCTRTDVHSWTCTEETSAAGAPRRHLAREMMRPAETTHLWRQRPAKEVINAMRTDVQNIALYECETARQEAMVIALKLRETLEDKTKTAALVTPDRELARQVQLICERWQIQLDNTGGTLLSDTALGDFCTLVVRVFLEDFRPSLLLSLLKHPLCGLGMGRGALLQDVQEIDLALRGPMPKDVFRDIHSYAVIQKVLEIKAAFPDFQSGVAVPAETLLHRHLDLLEIIAKTNEADGDARLWSGDAGEAAATFFHQLLQEADALGEITPAEYVDVLETLLRNVILRPAYGMHPRLLIMGQIEARLLSADVMILGGLNEGTWPALPEADPWMSRPMRKTFGLPDPERGIALAAHDFIQAFSSKDVVLTRSCRSEGTATVPARWLQRLDILLQAYDIAPAALRRGPLKEWALLLDRPEGEAMPATRPQPCPPPARRPRSLPVTAIETWMRDPYSLYAKYILGLRKLEEVEQESDAAQRGSWLHDVFEWFVSSYPDNIPVDAHALMMRYALEHAQAPKDIALFMPRLARLIDWFIGQETKWREIAQTLPGGLEVTGALLLENGFQLRAHADRIDRIKQSGGGVIIDYKTGRVPSGREIALGLSPQMPLEGAILNGRGFEQIHVAETETLTFWKPGGGVKGGEEKEVSGRGIPAVEDLITDALAGLENLVTVFSEADVPYISLPDLAVAPPEEWQDYAQLARVQEWASLDDGEAG